MQLKKLWLSLKKKIEALDGIWTCDLYTASVML